MGRVAGGFCFFSDEPLPPCLVGMQRSDTQMHRTSISVKVWMAETPSPEAVRPPRCLACGVPSRPVGGGLNLYGHGLRDRVLLGPTLSEGPPRDVVIRARRYRCQVSTCGAVILAVPCGVLARRRYSASAIGLALALWGICSLTGPQVRKRVSTSTIVGIAALGRWMTLSRWAEAATRRLFPKLGLVAAGSTRRATADRVATALVGHAHSADRHAPLESRAWLGGAQAS